MNWRWGVPTHPPRHPSPHSAVFLFRHDALVDQSVFNRRTVIRNWQRWLAAFYSPMEMGVRGLGHRGFALSYGTSGTPTLRSAQQYSRL